MHLLAAAVLTSWPTNTHVHLQYVYHLKYLPLNLHGSRLRNKIQMKYLFQIINTLYMKVCICETAGEKQNVAKFVRFSKCITVFQTNYIIIVIIEPDNMLIVKLLNHTTIVSFCLFADILWGIIVGFDSCVIIFTVFLLNRCCVRLFFAPW